ncbi:LPD7 domain-containing protein [Variovorax fucosicus]|uniref:LPD7 domain-containing protein n=1 Tax=Variovorax fucosicus TaxID=3053517 RepID=UPI0025762F99|nr:LPD7 domain-containing protein [Variovorax sp. J22G47]MDM0058964.1 hypothetical protein [Variovorax sp. J22G47]
MSTTPSDNDDPNAAGSVGEQPPNPASTSNRIVPDAVARRFLRIDDRYYFPDRTLAFVDTSTRLKVRTHNLEVVHSIVAIMQARGWRTVSLKGTHEFRQKVWHEATLQGIGVRGYEPSALEMQQLQHALDRDRAMHQGRPPAEGGPASGLPSTEERRAPRDGLRPPTVGVLLAHAAAPYQFDPMQRMSYYLRIQTEVGERTLWGTDLERALAESRSGVQVGDEVVLSQRGARPVTVRVPDRNAQGELVGDKKQIAQRMNWSVETTLYIESLNRKASLLRNGAVAGDAVLSQYPELAGAVAGMRLAELFAQRLTPRADDQARLVQAIRTRLADAIAQGQEVKLPPQRMRQTHVHQRGRSAPTPEDPGHFRA